ncbi:MAG: VWA domain-containing protein [Gammaproteobacteria bacterium]|nr:VWA domain-containing protein [Gammaproteobacteria bacterium]
MAIPDVRLIVDISRSMMDSDPDGMRSKAIGVFVQTLPHDAYAGIWTYGRYINMLVKHDRVDGLWKQVAGVHVADLPSVGLRADLTEAIARASWDRDVSMSNRVRHLVLLTDGKINIADESATNEASVARLLTELLPQLKDAGFRIHSLALGARADVMLLKQLSMATGGYHAQVSNPVQLPGFFLKVLDNVARLPRLPINDQQFIVDPGVTEITIFRITSNDEERLELVTPKGVRLSRTNSQPTMRWHTEPTYDLLTIKTPAVGRWEFVGATADNSRVMVVGDLVPSVSGLNGTLFPGELKAFEIELVGNGRRIEDETFLDLVEVRAVLETPLGERPLLVERLPKGEYKMVLLGLQEQGEHALRISISARTFERDLYLPFLVSSPVTLDIRPYGSGATIWVELNTPDVDYRSLKVAAKIKRPPGAAKLYPAERHPAGMWKFTVPESRGSVDIAVDISGNFLNKKEFRLRSEAVSFRLPLEERFLVHLDSGGARQVPAAIPIGPLQLDEGTSLRQTPPSAEVADVDQALPAVELPVQSRVSLPLWAGLSAAVFNLGLSFSLWFLLKVTFTSDTLADAIEALKVVLGGPVAAAEAAPRPEAV